MTQIQTIPLAKLKASPLNVRKTGGKKVDELAASIRASGLQQNLGVVADGDKFAVVFGGRRLRALQALKKAGELPEALADGIPCRVMGLLEAKEASLAENTIREAMHPLDQFQAFQALVDDGLDTAEVAARFGVTEKVVQQRLRLARVSPKLLQAYGEGELALDQLQAYAITDNHERQELHWKQYKDDHWGTQPARIRAQLLREEVGRGDPRVRLVGQAAYEAAGGKVRQDLFSDEVIFEDVALLDRLADEVVQEVARLLREDGWSWVETVRGYLDHMKYRAIEGGEGSIEYPEDEIHALEEKEFKGELTPAELLKLHLYGETNYSPEEKARSGAVVTIGYGGFNLHLGMVRTEEQAVAEDAAGEEGERKVHVRDYERRVPDPAPARQPGDMPFKAVQKLQAEATAILQHQLARAPHIALALLVAQLASHSNLYKNSWDSGPTWIHIAPQGGGRMPGPLKAEVEAGPYGGAMQRLAAAWRETLPKKTADLKAWALEQPHAVLMDLLSYLVACELDPVDLDGGQGSRGNGGLAELLEATGLGVESTWEPSEDWLATLSKPVILALVEDAAGEKAAQALASLKKSELPARALPLFPDGWVPPAIRRAAPVQQEPNPRAVAPKGKEAAAGEAA